VALLYNLFAVSKPLRMPVMASRPRLKLLALLHSSSSGPSNLGAPLPLPLARHISSSPRPRSATESFHGQRVPPPPPQRWVSDLRTRVGRCITFGCNKSQVARAARIVRALAEEWRPLTAGSEGFLSGGRRGLEGQKVVWGEQDSFVGLCFPVRATRGLGVQMRPAP
jgi:hypothetical protein